MDPQVSPEMWKLFEESLKKNKKADAEPLQKPKAEPKPKTLPKPKAEPKAKEMGPKPLPLPKAEPKTLALLKAEPDTKLLPNDESLTYDKNVEKAIENISLPDTSKMLSGSIDKQTGAIGDIVPSLSQEWGKLISNLKSTFSDLTSTFSDLTSNITGKLETIVGGPFTEYFKLAKSTLLNSYSLISGMFKKKERPEASDEDERQTGILSSILGYFKKAEKSAARGPKEKKGGIFGRIGAGLRATLSPKGLGKLGIIALLGVMIKDMVKGWIEGETLEDKAIMGAVGLTRIPRMIIEWAVNGILGLLGIDKKIDLSDAWMIKIIKDFNAWLFTNVTAPIMDFLTITLPDLVMHPIDTILLLVDKIRNFFTSTDGEPSGFQEVINFFSDIGSKVLNWIYDNVPGAKYVVDGIGSLLSQFGETVGDIFEDIKNFFIELPGKIYNFLKKIPIVGSILDLIEGTISLFGEVASDESSGIFDKIGNFVKGFSGLIYDYLKEMPLIGTILGLVEGTVDLFKDVASDDSLGFFGKVSKFISGLDVLIYNYLKKIPIVGSIFDFIEGTVSLFGEVASDDSLGFFDKIIKFVTELPTMIADYLKNTKMGKLVTKGIGLFSGDDKGLEQAKSAGIYEEKGWGNSEIDKSLIEEGIKTGKVTKEMLDAMLADNDMNKENTEWVKQMSEQATKKGSLYTHDINTEKLLKKMLGIDEDEAGQTSNIGSQISSSFSDTLQNFLGGGTKGTKGMIPTKGMVGSNTQKAMDWFTSKEGGGYTKEQAAGLVGNLQAESNLDAKAFNSAGGGQGAQGIAQWRGSRLKDFEKFSGKKMKDSTLEEQLGFVSYELKNKEKGADKYLRKSTTAEEAAKAVDDKFERSGGEHLARRQKYASAAMQTQKKESGRIETVQTDINKVVKENDGIKKSEALMANEKRDQTNRTLERSIASTKQMGSDIMAGAGNVVNNVMGSMGGGSAPPQKEIPEEVDNYLLSFAAAGLA